MSRPTVIDYFSGPGGLAEGFSQAGFKTLMGIDFDKNSAETFKENHTDSDYIQADISDLPPSKVLESLDVNAGEIDIVVGGPPCQGFSIAGDRKKNDDRNQLFKDYVRHIKEIQPKFMLMENVPGMLSMETPKGLPVIEKIQERFLNIGYRTEYDTLLASNYGVPQNRKRVFIIGTRMRDGILDFPDRTHIVEGQNQKLNETNEEIKEPITVKDALSDLPSLSAGEKSEKYKSSPQNDYQEKMREHMNSESKIKNHDAVNHRDHIVERFKHIPQGGDMTDAPEEHQPSKVYSSRNRRLIGDKPSYTVTSHVLDELIHPWDHRAITVREAARLQSFPDDYIFIGKRNVFHGADETSQYEQVGNAVPVLLAKKIAENIFIKNFESEY
jgi:DNA (cytosine-5)-methyltransferase 1